MPTLTEIVGVPTLPAGATDLKLTVILDPPYKGGPSIGLSAAQYDAVRSSDGSHWVYGTNSAVLAIPLARRDIPSPAPDGFLRAYVTYTVGGIKLRTEPKNFLPVAGTDGTLDLSVNQAPLSFILTPELAQLASTAQAQVQQLSDGLDLLSFGLTLIPPVAQDARDAAAQARSLLNSRFVRNQAERTAFFNSLNGADGVVIQLDTREVWRQLAGLVEMIGLYTVDGTGPSTIYVYQNSITAAQKPGAFLDSVVTVCIIDSNDGPHGFPSDKCRVRTDRTGHNLTQFGQHAWDVQWVYDYFTPKSWWRVGDINSDDWGPFVQLTGPTGSIDKSAIGVSVAPLNSQGLVPSLYLPAPAPLTADVLAPLLQPGPGVHLATVTTGLQLRVDTAGILPRLTGGTPGNFVVRVPGGWADAQETDLVGLQNSVVALLGLDNVIRAVGASSDSVGGFEGLRQGELVILGGQRAKGGRNWYTVPASALPVASDAAAVAIVGQVVSRSAIAPITPRISFPSIVAPTVYLDGFTANSDTNYAQPYGQGGGYYTANSKFTSGQSKVYFSEGNGKLTLYNRTPPQTSGLQNGRLLFEGNHEGSNVPDYFLLNMAGAYGAETGSAVRVDSTTNTGQANLALGRWDGTKAPGSKFITEVSLPLPWLTQNGAYTLEVVWQRTRLVARAYPIGGTVPAFELETFMPDGNHTTIGVGVEQGAISLGRFDATFGQVQVNLIFRDTTDVMPPINDFAPFHLAAVGDSLTDNENYLAALKAAFPGVSILNMGIGGQPSDAITGRVGGKTADFTVAGGVIPRNGSVAVAPVNNSILGTQNYDRQVFGYLNGVYGRLTIIGIAPYSQIGGTAQSYFFTRVGNGKAVQALSTVKWQTDTSKFQDRQVLIWQGRNNATSPTMAADVLANARLLDKAVRAAGGIPFHLTILFADQPGERSTDADHAQRDRIIATNQALLAEFGDFCIDVNALLSTDPNGVTPVAYRTYGQSVDPVHINAAGYAVIIPTIKARAAAHTLIAA